MGELMKKSLLKKSNEELVKKYHATPLNSVICYSIITIIIVAALMLLGATESTSDNEYLLFIVIGVCIAGPILGELIYPLGLQKQILTILQDRGINVWKKGKELGIKNSYKKAKTLLIIAIILWIINFIFKLFGGLVLVVFALAIAITLGGILMLASVIFQAAGSNGLASACMRGSKLATLPLKLAGKLLMTLLSFSAFADTKDTLNKYKENDNSYSADALETDPKKMSKELSDLQIDEYLSLDNVVSPTSQCEITKKKVEARGTHVYFEIEAVVTLIDGDTTSTTSYCEREIKSQAESELEKQVMKFLNTYPNATKVKVDGTVKILTVQIKK